MVPKEIWRSVAGYDGIYEVSNLGNVHSLPRRVRIGHDADRCVCSRVLAQTIHDKGYLVVALQRANKSTRFFVHRLVAAAFISPICKPMEVNHKDGNKTNNRLSNLEIVTRQWNIDHAVRTKLIDNKGMKNSQAVLTDELVMEIRNSYTRGGIWNGGKGYKALAKQYGVKWGTIRDIIKRQNWAHV